MTSALVTPALLAFWPVDPDAAAAVRASLSAAAQPEAPALNEWFRSIVPTNPFKAAADGAILPLVVFAAFFRPRSSAPESKSAHAAAWILRSDRRNDAHHCEVGAVGGAGGRVCAGD